MKAKKIIIIKIIICIFLISVLTLTMANKEITTGEAFISWLLVLIWQSQKI